MKNGLLKILQICDSLFPIGSYTLSNGLETYVQKNIISSAADLQKYLNSYILLMPYNELGAAYLSFSGEDLIGLDEVYNASKTAAEIRCGSVKTCGRFFKIAENFNENLPRLNDYKDLVKSGKCLGHLAIAYGAYMKDAGINIGDGLEIYGYSVCSAIITNCVKLVPLSQIEGQEILNESLEKISLAAEKATEISADEIGINGAGFELMAMEHETLYSRQYMS